MSMTRSHYINMLTTSKCSEYTNRSMVAVYIIPLFDQLIHIVLLECSPSLNQVLLQLWRNEVTLND